MGLVTKFMFVALISSIFGFVTSFPQVQVVGSPDQVQVVGSPDQVQVVDGNDLVQVVGLPDQVQVVGPPDQVQVVDGNDQVHVVGGAGHDDITDQRDNHIQLTLIECGRDRGLPDRLRLSRTNLTRGLKTSQRRVIYSKKSIANNERYRNWICLCRCTGTGGDCLDSLLHVFQGTPQVSSALRHIRFEN